MQGLLKSLKHKQVAPGDRDFGHVWNVHATKEGIYFQTRPALFRWSDKGMRVWKTREWIHLSFMVRGDLYLSLQEAGLLKIKDDTLQIVPGSEELKNHSVYAMLPYPDPNGKKMLIGSRESGLLLYDGTSIRPFANEANDFLREGQIRQGALLPDGNFALATRRVGLVIIDKDGRLLHHFDTSTGLADDKVYFVFPDRQGALWLGLNSGIARIEMPELFSNYDDPNGLRGTVQSIIRHQGTLYVGTDFGVFYLQSGPQSPFNSGKRAEDGSKPGISSPKPSVFKKVSGYDDICYSLLSVPLLGTLFAGGIDLSRIDGNVAYTMKDGAKTWKLYRSRKHSNRIFLCLEFGFASLRFTGSAWIDEGEVAEIQAGIGSIMEDNDGILWLRADIPAHRVLRVKFPQQNAASLGLPKIKSFEFEDLTSEFGMMYSLGGEPVFEIDSNVFRFDKVRQQFRSPAVIQRTPGADSLSSSPDGSYWEHDPLRHLQGLWDDELIEDRSGNIWFAAKGRLCALLRQPDGTYRMKRNLFFGLPEMDIEAIYPEDNGVVWVGGSGGLIRYDSNIRKDITVDFSALVRRVIVNGDSVVFGGAWTSLSGAAPVLAYSNNALRFEVAAPSFDKEAANRFQFFLVGFDNEWSNWTDETQKDYTNLPEGTHRFRVRAKNIYEHISSESVFTFEILPPWYRAWWAYGFYALLFVGLLLGSMQWRGRKLIKEKEALEQIIAERTQEVKAQAEKLQEMDKLKSRFFANISHEFRTPLTLIIDPLNAMISDSFAGDLKRQYGVMKRNAGRLLRLINQLLDLSKLESGMMKVQAGFNNIVPFLKGVVYSFESTATVRNIDLNFKCDEDSIELYYDRDKLEQIVTNLLSNALKFTPEGGSVIVDCRLQIANLKDHQPKIRNPKLSRFA